MNSVTIFDDGESNLGIVSWKISRKRIFIEVEVAFSLSQQLLLPPASLQLFVLLSKDQRFEI